MHDNLLRHWHYPASSVCQSQVSGKFLRTLTFSGGNAAAAENPGPENPAADANITSSILDL